MAAPSKFATLVHEDPKRARTELARAFKRLKTVTAVAKHFGIDRSRLYDHMDALKAKACAHCGGSGLEPEAQS